jgi:hypothetical protein
VTTADELIERTRKLGVHLWVSDGTLGFRAPRAAFSAELQTELLTHKASIIEALSGPRYERAPEGAAIDLPEALLTTWNQIRDGDIGASYTNGTNMLKHFTCLVDLQALERALHNLMRKHNALRCRLSDDEGGLRFAFDRTPELTTIDMSDYGWSEIYGPFMKAAQDIVWRPFARGECLFRPFVFKLPASEIVIGFVVNHFIVDAWSFKHIPRYWAMEYKRQLAQQTEDDNSRDYLQYSEYLLGVARWSKTLNFQRRMDYWKETLKGVVPSRLPPDRPVDYDARSFHGSLPVEFDVEVVKRLGELAASVGVTLTDVLLAGVVIALQRQLQISDICLRQLWHGRDEPRLFDMIGNTLNPLILRIRLSPGSRLRDVAQQVHRVGHEAIANQVPCYHIDKMLNEAGTTAFVQTNFQFRENARGLMRENAAASSLGSPVSIWNSNRAFATPRYLQAHDINLFVAGGSVSGRISYLENVYDEETIKRFIDGFHQALQH